MSLPKDEAWFPAKRYGYGWGFPRRWQGWIVVLAYCGALIGTKPYAKHNRAAYFAFVMALTAIMIGICYWKGESAKWRWGEDKD